jgi:hypothetical protein
VTFQDMALQPLSAVQRLVGFAKIQGCAKRAASDAYEWIWVDTCCIDKTSSSELSEAINSMFNWYQSASICFVYLSDVTQVSEQTLYSLHNNSDASLISHSRWFTRGWTLQELIAPRAVEFFSANWVSIGTRWSLQSLLSDLTSIPKVILKGNTKRLYECSVAQRMSWAARRVTTREEDIAYCLLGIFDVNMPLLYGEGTRAFRRLQEEILRRSEDLSLLAWATPSEIWTHNLAFLYADPDLRSQEGIFAPSPKEFITSRIEKVDYTFGKANLSEVDPTSLSILPTTVADSEQLAYPPATITSRGVLATLLVAKDPTSRLGKWLLAWTFARLVLHNEDPEADQLESTYFVCLRLEGSSKAAKIISSANGAPGEPVVVRRSEETAIVLLEPQHLNKLVPVRLYLAYETGPHQPSRHRMPQSRFPSASSLYLAGRSFQMPFRVEDFRSCHRYRKILPKPPEWSVNKTEFEVILKDNQQNVMWKGGVYAEQFMMEVECTALSDLGAESSKPVSEIYIKWAVKQKMEIWGLGCGMLVRERGIGDDWGESRRVEDMAFKDKMMRRLSCGHFATICVKIVENVDGYKAWTEIRFG